MEMQKVATNVERNKEIEETSGLMEEAKTNKEEAEREHYSKLENPCEDVYSEALYVSPAKRKAGKQTEGNIRLYRGVCIFLTTMCLVLLLTVIILSLQLQTGSTVCPEGKGAAVDSERRTCSAAECRVHLGRGQPQNWYCSLCPPGWLMFGSSCFYLSTFRLNWDESQRNCTGDGGFLAVVDNTSIQDFLTSEGNMPYWIGLRRNRGRWTWSDKSVLKDSYWADDWADGKSDKDCAILRSVDPPNKNWVTTSCKNYAYFICQRPHLSSSTE